MLSVLIITCDEFSVGDGRVWSSPIVSHTIRLFGDNFGRVGIVAHQDPGGPEKGSQVAFPDSYCLHPIPNVRGVLNRAVQACRVFSMVRRLARQYDVIYPRMFTYQALPAAVYCSTFRRSDWFLSLHGDIEEAIEISRSGRPGVYRYVLATLMGTAARAVCQGPRPLFVSGPALGHRYAPQREDAIPFMDSGLRYSDIYRGRTDTCTAPPFRLCVVGDLAPRKGVGVLLDALRLLRAKEIPVEVRIIGGDRKSVEDCRAAARARQVENVVQCLGYIPYGTQLFRAIRECDILVVPSLGAEGWNRTITEANAQGLPVVASDIDSMGIAVREGPCGIAVPPGDAGSLAEAIARIIYSPELRSSMVAAGLRRAEYYVFEEEFKRVRASLERVFTNGLVPWEALPERLEYKA